MKKIVMLVLAGLFLVSGPVLAAKGAVVQKEANLATKNVNTTAWSVEADKWLFAGEEVVNVTQNENAKTIMSYLRESYYLGIPIFHKTLPAFKIYHLPDMKIRLCIVPLLASDKRLSKAWEEVYNSNLAACFVPDPDQPHLILKDSSQLSRNWQGIVLIHEGSHALAFAASVFNQIEDPLMRRTMDELYAYSLETELVEKIGGEAYKQLLDEEVERIGKDYVEKKNIALPDYARNRERLEKIFGKSNSELETKVRGSVFWINAVFRLIDKIYQSPEERQSHKADFLYASYKNGNME